MKGKNVLVVGATGGVGGSVVRTLLDEGFAVHFTGRDPGRLAALASACPEARAHRLDATDAHAVRSLVDSIDGEAPLDAYVHLAGGYRDGKTIDLLEDDDWTAMRDVNWTSLRHAASAAFRLMRSRGSGSIVTVSSTAALEGGAAMAPYAVTKAAVLAFTRCLAVEGRACGVRANCIVPTTIDTPANRTAMPGSTRRGWVAPEQTARAIAFLCGPSSEGVTGAVLTLRGPG